MMLAGTIRNRLESPSFEPFVICMTDGRAFAIRHPDFADVSPKGRVVVVYDDDDAAIELSSLLLASIEPIRGDSAAKT